MRAGVGGQSFQGKAEQTDNTGSELYPEMNVLLSLQGLTPDAFVSPVKRMFCDIYLAFLVSDFLHCFTALTNRNDQGGVENQHSKQKG